MTQCVARHCDAQAPAPRRVISRGYRLAHRLHPIRSMILRAMTRRVASSLRGAARGASAGVRGTATIRAALSGRIAGGSLGRAATVRGPLARSGAVLGASWLVDPLAIRNLPGMVPGLHHGRGPR